MESDLQLLAKDAVNPGTERLGSDVEDFVQDTQLVRSHLARRHSSSHGSSRMPSNSTSHWVLYATSGVKRAGEAYLLPYGQNEERQNPKVQQRTIRLGARGA